MSHIPVISVCSAACVTHNTCTPLKLHVRATGLCQRICGLQHREVRSEPKPCACAAECIPHTFGLKHREVRSEPQLKLKSRCNGPCGRTRDGLMLCTCSTLCPWALMPVCSGASVCLCVHPTYLWAPTRRHMWYEFRIRLLHQIDPPGTTTGKHGEGL